MQDNCIFCQIAAGRAPADIVFKDQDVVAFRDLHPVAPTHILIIPRRHLNGISDAEPADQALLGKLLLTAGQIAATEQISSYRLVANTGRQAGQSVFHLHLHLLADRPMSWPPG
jgi:histidine triad (HIT) family protein